MTEFYHKHELTFGLLVSLLTLSFILLSPHPQGDFAPQNMMRVIARQVCENLFSGEQELVLA